VQVTLYVVEIQKWLLAICTVQVTLYSTSECDMKFAIAEVILHNIAVQNWWVVNCTVQLHCTVWHYKTGDLQFALH